MLAVTGGFSLIYRVFRDNRSMWEYSNGWGGLQYVRWAIVLVSFRAAERVVKQTVCDCECVCFYKVKNAHPWRGGKLKMAISVTSFCKGNYSSSVDRESTP